MKTTSDYMICQNCQHLHAFHGTNGEGKCIAAIASPGYAYQCKCDQFKKTDVVSFIDSKIEYIFKHLVQWNGCYGEAEIFESQILVLLEIRDIAILGAPKNVDYEFYHFRKQKNIIYEKNHRESLAVFLKKCTTQNINAIFIELMKEFVDQYKSNL